GITPAERDALWARGRAAFGQLLGEQADHIAAADPVDLFFGLVRAAVASGRAHIADRTGAEPAGSPESWGCRSRVVGGGHYERTEWQPLGHRVGWVDGDSVYLEPDGIYAEAQRLAAEQGQSIPVTPRTLHRRLNERGFLARVEQSGRKTRYCVRVVLEGQRRDVLCFSAATLFPDGSAPSAPGSDETPAEAHESGRTPTGECATPSPECANGAPGPDRVRHAHVRETAGKGVRMAHSAHSRNGDASTGGDGGWSEWE
ncbi:MAG: hypothetical protein J2P46_07725, partial [Zavarzinella sp.]|nr:hypothetical protein [Zavarzinella sp.]